VLTSSRRHPRRWAAVPVVRVERGAVATALRAVVAAHSPASAVWSRCPRCNVALHARSAFEARGEVPGRVTRLRGVTFRSCPSCGQWYWTGSHVARMTTWFEQALGRAIERLDERSEAPASRPAVADESANVPAAPPATDPAGPPRGADEPGKASS